MLMWVIWNNRNNRVWNDLKESGRSLRAKARLLWEEWSSVNQHQRNNQPAELLQQTQFWHKPSSGWYKCNVDAGFHRDLNKTSLGWCLRDHLGNFVMAGTGWREGNYSIVEGEALALFEALKVMEQKGLSHVLVETDSKSVVNAIQHLRDGHSQFSVLIRSIKNVLLLHPNFKVSFIKRQANMVAHTFARAATSWSSRCIFETLPPCIASILSNEMS
ncbi:uncharacterized protein LOC123894295 [Trifolium pratense]|uniref:uncharacterized protein LOC123894295 n=1 Tax=Trifolium pratense TaxID=57577 RepID=UPI001E6937D7|nr:uncharacterized protein LOC123894295 [Trifolium pratense]